MPSSSLHGRIALAGLLTAAPAAAIAGRLAQLQVLEHRRLASMALGEMTGEAVEIIPRGRILDRDGRVLAQAVPSWSAFLDPGAAPDPADSARRAASALGLPASEALAKARRKTRFTWLKRRLSPEEKDRLRALALPGVGLLPDESREYPNGELARALLGQVGADGRGQSGLELAYDRTLSGAALRVRLMRDGKGRRIAASREARRPPPDLTLTLRRGVQHHAEEALAEAVSRHRPAKGVVLVQDPWTGDLLAAAEHPVDPLRSIALQEAFEPGSTFKIVAMAGALDEGTARLGDEVDAEGGRWELASGVAVRDHEPYGRLSLSAVMEKSSNIGMAKLGLGLGSQRFHRRCRIFGFGTRTSLAFPGENPGLLKAQGELTRVVLANNSFGQGVAATAVQLVGAYSALANGGALLEPRLVAAVGGEPAPPPVRVRRVASEATVAVLRSMLEGVVTRGTALSAAVPGFAAAGKTGTAQKLDPASRTYSRTQYVASFIGFAPASRPRFTVLVVLDSPQGQYYGADVAAPVFSKLMRRLLALDGIPPEAAAPPAPPLPAPFVRRPPERLPAR